jgi:hypothetical protein
LIQPLTKLTKDGIPLRRRPDMERRIGEILALPEDEIIRRAEISDLESPDYLPSECLVYLIRLKRSAPARTLVEELTPALVKRCIAATRNHVVGFSRDDVQEIIDEIKGRLIERIIERSNRWDYLEVNFAHALKCLRIDVCRKFRTMREKETPLSEMLDANQQMTDWFCESNRVRVSETVSAALRTLTADELEVLLLRYVSRVPIDANKTSRPTLVRITKRSVRTIRSRLRSAEQKFKKAIRQIEDNRHDAQSR